MGFTQIEVQNANTYLISQLEIYSLLFWFRDVPLKRREKKQTINSTTQVKEILFDFICTPTKGSVALNSPILSQGGCLTIIALKYFNGLFG